MLHATKAEIFAGHLGLERGRSFDSENFGLGSHILHTGTGISLGQQVSLMCSST